jgi:hypothetical protein
MITSGLCPSWYPLSCVAAGQLPLTATLPQPWIEYLATASAGTWGRPGLWDPFKEAAHVIDAGLWYRTSFEATPERSVTRWLPPDGSGLATVAVYAQGPETAVLIRHESPQRSNRRWWPRAPR